MVADSLLENHKGRRCLHKDILCQEGYCARCTVYTRGKILEECPEWKICPKKVMVLDKGFDILELYWVAMRSVCERCREDRISA